MLLPAEGEENGVNSVFPPIGSRRLVAGQPLAGVIPASPICPLDSELDSAFDLCNLTLSGK